MATEIVVDEIETLRGECLRRVVATNQIFTLEQIQVENAPAPDTMPYCRLTVAQSGSYEFSSQNKQRKTVIVEFDIMVRALTQTQLAGQLAAKIDKAFGKYSRSSSDRTITMTGWTGANAVVSKYGRGTPSVEAEKNLYYLPVLIYVDISLDINAKYEA